MSEQYAFAIGFDVESMHDEIATEGEQSHLSHTPVNWESVAAAILAANLPPIDSSRWDEFGQGRIFWGTKAECDAVHHVLSQFDLYIEEARNLEPGYYSTANATYYVDGVGNIYVLPQDLQGITAETVEPVIAIPLDAYRLKTVDLDLDAKVQSYLQALSPDSVPPPAIAPDVLALDTKTEIPAEQTIIEQELTAEKVALADYTALQAEVELQRHQIHELERQVTAFEDQITELQSTADIKIDPQVHAAVQAELAQTTAQLNTLQTQIRELPPLIAEPAISTQEYEALQQQIAQQSTRILDLEAQLAQANLNATEWQHRAAQAIDPTVHQQLQQQLKAQTLETQELSQVVRQLEQQLQESTITAAQKVDAAKHKALMQELTDKSTLVADLRHTIQQLERDASEWQSVAESKVDWAEFQAVQAELQQLKAKSKKGLFARLFGWLSR